MSQVPPDAGGDRHLRGSSVDAARVDALLGAPAGRRLLAEIAGVRFISLLDALDLAYPPNVAGFRAVPRPARRRRSRRALDRRVRFDPLHRGTRSTERGMRAHRDAVLRTRPEDVAAVVAHMTTGAHRVRPVDVEDTGSLLEALGAAVSDFGFGGNDAEFDHLLRAAHDALRPVAQALVASPASRWWWDDVARGDQRYIAPRGEEAGGPPRGAQLAGLLARALERLRHDETEAKRRHGSPGGVRANASGEWWSTPVPACFTSRAIPPIPALQAVCAEDRGEGPLSVWSVRISASANIVEVRRPSDWAQLVDVAAVDVTMSRLGDWRRWTGKEGPFHLPDWQAIAAHVDGVHLTVGGYLATRSVPIPVTGGWSVLAGWDPDTTLWLRDVIESVELVGEWEGPSGFFPGA